MKDIMGIDSSAANEQVPYNVFPFNPNANSKLKPIAVKMKAVKWVDLLEIPLTAKLSLILAPIKKKNIILYKADIIPPAKLTKLLTKQNVSSQARVLFGFIILSTPWDNLLHNFMSFFMKEISFTNELKEEFLHKKHQTINLLVVLSF